MSSFDQLIPVLEKNGYFRHYLSLSEGNMRTWDWKLFAAKLNGPAKLCWRFFLRGSRVARADLESVCAPAQIDKLLKLGLATEKNGKVSLGQTVLIHCLGKPVFIDQGEPSRSRLGDDVVAIIAQVPTAAKARKVLSLYSVGGAETLNFAARGGPQMTVMSHASSHPFIKANWELNGGSVGSLHLSDSAKNVGRGKFDLIMARIPSMPVPEAYQDLDLDAGKGADGAELIRETLALTANRLAAGGNMGFTCLLGGGEKPGPVVSKFRKMVKAAGLSVEAEILSKQRLEPGVTLFNQAIYLAEKQTLREVRTLMDDFMEFYQASDFEYVYFVKGIVRQPEEKGKPKDRIIELTDRYFGTWTV